MLAGLLDEWNATLGAVGVRDPAYPCEAFDGRGYDGRGECHSDGHYLCTGCSHLSEDAPRFHQNRDGRRDRLRLYFAYVRRRDRMANVLPRRSAKGESK